MRIWNYYQRHFMGCEFVAVTVAVLVSALVLEFGLGSSPIESLLGGIRESFYAVVASVAGSLVGFAIAAVSIMMTFMQSPRLDILRRSKHHAVIYRTFLTAIKYLAFTTAIAIICLIADRDANAKVWLTYLCIYGIILSIVALTRCVWILERTVTVITKKVETK